MTQHFQHIFLFMLCKVYSVRCLNFICCYFQNLIQNLLKVLSWSLFSECQLPSKFNVDIVRQNLNEISATISFCCGYWKFPAKLVNSFVRYQDTTLLRPTRSVTWGSMRWLSTHRNVMSYSSRWKITIPWRRRGTVYGPSSDYEDAWQTDKRTKLHVESGTPTKKNRWF